jgi:hypothetical protein
LPANLDDECGGRSFHLSLRHPGLGPVDQSSRQVTVDSAERERQFSRTKSQKKQYASKQFSRSPSWIASPALALGLDAAPPVDFVATGPKRANQALTLSEA